MYSNVKWVSIIYYQIEVQSVRVMGTSFSTERLVPARVTNFRVINVISGSRCDFPTT